MSRWSESDHKALLEGWEGSGGPPAGLGGVGRPSQRIRRGRESLLESREGLGWPGEVESPSRRAERGQKASRRARRGREALLVRRGGVGRTGRVWEDLPNSRERPGSPPGGLGGVGRPSRRAGRCR